MFEIRYEEDAGPAAPADAPSSTSPRTPAAPSEVARLRSLLTDLAAVDPVELPETVALAETRELLAAQAQLDRLLLRRLGDVDSRKLHRLDGSPTITSWVRAQDAAVDASTITLSRRLSRLPGLRLGHVTVDSGQAAGSRLGSCAGNADGEPACARLRPTGTWRVVACTGRSS